MTSKANDGAAGEANQPLAPERRARIRQQFRLTWDRGEYIVDEVHFHPIKSKNFASLKAAERYVRILTADEPWREWAPNKGPDDYVCCRGDAYSECGCGGLTHAQDRDEKRKNLPPIISMKLEKRSITSTPFVLVDAPLLAQEPSSVSSEGK